MNLKMMQHALAELEYDDLDRLQRSLINEKEHRDKRRIEDARREAREVLAKRGVRLYDALPPRLKAKLREEAQGWDYVGG